MSTVRQSIRTRGASRPAPRSRPGRLADPLRAARLLAQPRPRDLHVRVPDHVPGDLREPRQRGSTSLSCGGIPYDDFFVPGILAYGVIATTFVNLAISTAILRDEGVLKRMQGTPLPRWAYVAARIGSTVGDHARDDDRRARARDRGLRRPRARRRAAGADRHAAARHGRVHDARDRDHAVHPQRRDRAGVRQPDRAAV